MTALSGTLRTFHLLLSALALAAILYLHHQHPVVFVHLITEDQWGEYATAIAFLASAGLAGAVAASSIGGRRLTFATIAMGCFLVAMEELAWGQRIFRFDAPDPLRQINAQDETTLHNIRGVHDITRAALFSWCLAGALLISVVVSGVLRIARPAWWHAWQQRSLPLPGMASGAWFVLSAAFLAQNITIKSDEIGELLLSVGVVAYCTESLIARGPRIVMTPAGQWAITVAVLLAIAGCTFVLSRKRPGLMHRRLELAAQRDYPRLGMHAQAQQIRDYLALQHSDDTPDDSSDTTAGDTADERPDDTRR